MSRRALATVLLAALAVAVALAVHPWRADPLDGPAATGRVTRVVDGDTIHVAVGDEDETVRYIGMDTPESVEPGTPVQCYAERAATANARLVAGREVRLRFDAERRDRYGRLLAYVYTEPGGAFVNAALVRGGYARTLVIPPNTAHARQLAALQHAARHHDRGLWSACGDR